MGVETRRGKYLETKEEEMQMRLHYGVKIVEEKENCPHSF